MSFTSEYMELRKKRKKNDQNEISASEGSFSGVSTSAIKTDIAPVKEVTEDKADLLGLDFFQKGAFEDGYQFGDVTKTILGTTGDAAVGALKGITTLGEGIVDLAAYGVAGVADLVGNDRFADIIRKETAKSQAEQMWGWADKLTDKSSVLGDTSDAILQGVGQVAGIYATAGLGKIAGLGHIGTTALTTGTMFASSFGGGIGEALTGGATDEEALKYGAFKGAVDAGTEMLFGGLGKYFKALGVSKGISSLDDVFAKKLSSKISSRFWANAAEYGVKASAEGAEEVLACIGTAAAKKLTYMSDEELTQLIEDENLLEQFVVGAVTSGIAQGGDFVSSVKKGQDFITGLTENEQKVIDKVYEDRIAEKEKNGETLTNKAKNKLYDEVLTEMGKGYISTDTIEEVLGGDTYKSYRDTVDSEDAMQAEYGELRKLKVGDMTVEQQERYQELKQQIAEIKEKSSRSEQQAKLSREVSELVKDTRLAESYNERARRGQTFEADVSQYDAKQRETVQRAIDSGVLNNTNRTHELVDLIAKVSADKGIAFDFANNAKIKESGFALEGATVNGYVTDAGITINIQSAKTLNRVVGHEITHVLEGTELYDTLQAALFDYAKTKGDYQGRYDAIVQLYKNVENADIDAELTADLVGDYLFTDSDFIRRLSTEHRNIFEKIYDEIKYLCKVATAGSKEARDLEKVKKAFEKAYKAQGHKKNTATKGGVRYSLSDVKLPTREELIEKDPVMVVDISTPQTEGTFSERRRQILDDMEEIIAKPYLNKDTGALIFLTKESYKHAFNNIGALQLNAAEHLPELIENAVLTHAESITHGNEYATGIYTFFAAAKGKRIYPVKLKVKEYNYAGQELPKNIKEYFDSQPQDYAASYDTVVLEVEEIKESSSGSDKDISQSDFFLTPEELSTISVADLLDLVKGDSKKFIPEFSLSPANEDIAPIGNFDIYGKDVMLETAQENIAPVREDLAPTAAKNTATEDIAPVREDIKAKKEGEPRTAKVLVEEPKTRKKRRSLLSLFKTNFLDKGAVFEDLSLKTKNRELMGKWNYTLSSEARAQRLIGHGADGVKSLVDIRNAVESTGKTQQFYDYLYHKHNVDRMNLDTRYEGAKNKPVFGDSVTANVSQDIVDRLEAENPQFEALAQDVYTYMNHLRGLMVDNGVISQETADLWAEMYPHYVPTQRAVDHGASINVPLDTRRTGINTPVKRAKGGDGDISPLFKTMATRTEQTFKAIARNSFGLELMRTLDTAARSETANVDDVIDSVDDQDGLLQKSKNGKNPTFSVFENGKKVTFEITEDMYDALKPTGEGLAYTNKVANTAMSVFRGLLTEYNPTFMLTNAVKDAQDVLINSQHAAKTYAKIPQAIKELATGGKWYTEYLESGGEQNTYFEKDTNAFKKENTAFVKAIGMPLRAISAANNFIERVPRLAEYIASREAGRSIEVSMLDAARVTTNFAAGGDVTKFANRNGFTFLNASVQGFNQQVRNMREAKVNGLKGWVQLAAKVTFAGMSAVLLNNLLWDDDEEYEGLSDYVKENYYIVAKYSDGQFVRIPKGRAVAVIQNAFEQMDNLRTGDDEVDLATFWDLAVTNLAPNSPIDNNLLAPIFQVAKNKTWYGEDLVPTRLQDVPAAEQYDESTDSISKWLGEKLNYSPYKINYLLNQYTGGLGDVFLPMMTPEAESGNGSLAGYALAPLKDKFTTDSVMNNQSVTDFYDTVDELAVNANSSAATDEDKLKYKYISSVNAELGELYKQKREIQNSDLANDKKYETARKLQQQIDNMAAESLSSYGDVHISGSYATVGDRHYKLNDEGEWQKLNDKQVEKLKIFGKAVGGSAAYISRSSELNAIKSDKDANGDTIAGSRKKKVVEYINGLDAEYGEKIVLFKSQYPGDDTYNYEIVDYLNGRKDISYTEMEAILTELGFTVAVDGSIWW